MHSIMDDSVEMTARRVIGPSQLVAGSGRWYLLEKNEKHSKKNEKQ